MGNQPAAPRAGGGDPRHQDESTPRDGAAAAGARPDRRVRFASQETGARSPPGTDQQAPVHAGDDAGTAGAPARMPPRRPSYPPSWLRRGGEGQPRAAAPPRPEAGHRPPPVPATHARVPVPEEPQATPLAPPPGARPPRAVLHTSTPTDGGGGAGSGFQHERPPPRGPRYVPPRPPPKERRHPMALCCMACCILFWLLVVAVGVAVLVVFLVYHPKPPRLRVTSATLNTGHIDSDARELSADLTVLAAISNPNAKLHIVLRYMQLGLYFEGGMIAAQAVWPAPLHEGPRGTVLRTVRLVASNVTMAPPAVFVWQNATTSGGGPVVLELAGRFHTQLNVGRWLRYRFWAKPRCTLWLDPPPGGALRRSQC